MACTKRQPWTLGHCWQPTLTHSKNSANAMHTGDVKMCQAININSTGTTTMAGHAYNHVQFCDAAQSTGTMGYALGGSSKDAERLKRPSTSAKVAAAPHTDVHQTTTGGYTLGGSPEDADRLNAASEKVAAAPPFASPRLNASASSIIAFATLATGIPNSTGAAICKAAEHNSSHQQCLSLNLHIMSSIRTAGRGGIRNHQLCQISHGDPKQQRRSHPCSHSTHRQSGLQGR